MTAKVLLVEADSTSGADLRSSLARNGYSVTLVRDGQLGLSRAVSERFDAVVVSAELPGINGFRICNRIRKDPNVADVRLFIIGAEPEDFAAHERLPTKADSYFKKPVVVAELIARMRLHGIGAPPTLSGEISSACKDVQTIAELRKHIAEQDRLLEQATKELAKAHAEAVRSLAPPPEGRTAPTKIPRPVLPLPSGSKLTRRPDGPSPEVLDLRQQLVAQKESEKALRDNLASVATEARTLAERVREQARTIALSDKQQKAIVEEREVTRKRIEELTARLDRSKEDMQRVRDEAVAARKDATEARAAIEEAKQEARTRSKAERDELEARIERLQQEAAARAAARQAELDAARAGNRDASLGDRDRRIRELETQTRELTESRAAVEKTCADLRAEVESARERATRAEDARERDATELASIREGLPEVVTREQEVRESLAVLERTHRERLDALMSEHAVAIEAERRRADEEARARATAEYERATREAEQAQRDDAIARDLILATRTIAQLRQEATARDRARAETEKRLAAAEAEIAKAKEAHAEAERVHSETLAEAARSHAAELEDAVKAAILAEREERRRTEETDRAKIAAELDSTRRNIDAQREAATEMVEKLGNELSGALDKIAELEKELAEALAAAEAERAERERILGEFEIRNIERQLDALTDRESRDASTGLEEALAGELAQLKATLNAERQWFDIQAREHTAAATDAVSRTAALEASIDELSAALVAANRETDTERQNWRAERTGMESTIRALEASLEARVEAIEQLERELDEAHREVPELEAEIVVLRSELMNLRRKLDTQVLHERAAIEQLERNRDLLARAQRLLEERGLGETDGPESTETTGSSA